MKEEHICCICGKEFKGYGNNPYPVNKEEGARCCDECNDKMRKIGYFYYQVSIRVKENMEVP